MRRSAVVLVLVVLAACGGNEDIPTVFGDDPKPFTTVSSTPKGPPQDQMDAAFGTTVTVPPGDRRVTVFAYKTRVTSTNQFTKPEAGNRFDAAEVQECAGPGGEPFGPGSPHLNDFVLVMPDSSRRVSSIIPAQEPNLVSLPLRGGECIRGWVTFEVRESAEPRFVAYISRTTTPAMWRIT